MTNTPYFLDHATRPSSDMGRNDPPSAIVDATPSASASASTSITALPASTSAVVLVVEEYNSVAGNVVVGGGGGAGPSTTSMTSTMTTSDLSSSSPRSLPPILKKIVDKVGKIDESRMMSPPEYLNGDVPNLFSNIKYDVTTRKRTSSSSSSIYGEMDDDVEVIVTARQSTNNGVLSSSVLLCGTSLGCGLLFLPHAIYPSGYLPAIVASIVAWAYMTMTALLTSELLINRYGETGKARNVGLLELYAAHLGDVGGKVAGIGFLVVSYLVVGVYLAEGGDRLSMLLADVASTTDTATTIVGGGGGVPFPSLLGRALFVAGAGALLSLASRYNAVQSVITNFLVPTTLIAFIIAMCIGSPTTDLSSLFASTNQHPELVLNAFPLLFMGWTYHGVVPRVVYDLEGDKAKITRAIVLGEYTTCIFSIS